MFDWRTYSVTILTILQGAKFSVPKAYFVVNLFCSVSVATQSLKIQVEINR